MIESISSLTLNSISNIKNQAYSYAQNISNFPNSDSDAIVNDIIGLKICEQQMAINLKLIKIEDEMTQDILDIFA